MVAVLFTGKDQPPVIPFKEVVGNAPSGAPVQIGETAVNVGVMLELTEIVIVAIVAHCPVVGVNV